MALKEACEDDNLEGDDLEGGSPGAIVVEMATKFAGDLAEDANTVILPFEYPNFKETQRKLIYLNPPSLGGMKRACGALKLPEKLANGSPLLIPCHNYFGGNSFMRFTIARGGKSGGFRAISILLTGSAKHHRKIRTSLSKMIASKKCK